MFIRHLLQSTSWAPLRVLSTGRDKQSLIMQGSVPPELVEEIVIETMKVAMSVIILIVMCYSF